MSEERRSGSINIGDGGSDKDIQDLLNLLMADSSNGKTPKKKDTIKREVKIKTTEEGSKKVQKELKETTKVMKELTDAAKELKDEMDSINSKRPGKSNLANLWTHEQVSQAERMTKAVKDYNEQVRMYGENSKEALNYAMDVVKWTNAYKGFGYQMDKDAKASEKLAKSLEKVLDNAGKQATEYYAVKDFEEMGNALKKHDKETIASVLSGRAELVKIIKKENSATKKVQRQLEKTTKKNAISENVKEISDAIDKEVEKITKTLDQAMNQMEKNKGRTTLGQVQLEGIYKYFYTLEHLLDKKAPHILSKYEKFVEYLRTGSPDILVKDIKFKFDSGVNRNVKTRIDKEAKQQAKAFLKDPLNTQLQLPELKIQDMTSLIEAEKKEQEVIIETRKKAEEQQRIQIQNQKRIQEEINKTTKAMRKQNEIIKESKRVLSGNTQKNYEVSKNKESAYKLFEKMNDKKYSKESDYVFANYLANKSRMTDSEDLQKLFKDTASIFYYRYLKNTPTKDQKLLSIMSPKGKYEFNSTLSNSLITRGKSFDSILNPSSFYEKQVEEALDRAKNAELVYEKLEKKFRNLNESLSQNSNTINNTSKFEIKEGTSLSSAQKQLQNLKKERNEVSQLLDIYTESISRIRRTVEKGEFSVEEVISTISKKASTGNATDFDMASIYWGALGKETGKTYSIKNENGTDITLLLLERIKEIQSKLPTGTEKDLHDYNDNIEQLNKYITALKEKKKAEQEAKEAEMAMQEAQRKAQEEAFLRAEQENKKKKKSSTAASISYNEESTGQFAMKIEGVAEATWLENEAEEALNENISITNENVEGQISLLDFLAAKKKNSTTDQSSSVNEELKTYEEIYSIIEQITTSHKKLIGSMRQEQDQVMKLDDSYQDIFFRYRGLGSILNAVHAYNKAIYEPESLGIDLGKKNTITASSVRKYISSDYAKNNSDQYIGLLAYLNKYSNSNLEPLLKLIKKDINIDEAYKMLENISFSAPSIYKSEKNFLDKNYSKEYRQIGEKLGLSDITRINDMHLDGDLTTIEQIVKRIYSVCGAVLPVLREERQQVQEVRQEAEKLYDLTNQYFNLISNKDTKSLSGLKNTLQILGLINDTYNNILQKIYLMQVPREEYVQSSEDLYNSRNRSHNLTNTDYIALRQSYQGVIENEIIPNLEALMDEVYSTLVDTKIKIKSVIRGPKLKQTPTISEEEFIISQEAIEKAKQIKQAIGAKNTDTELIAIKVDEILQGADALEKVHEIMQLLSKDSALFSKSSKETWEQWKLVRDYISKSTIKIDSKFKSDLGDDFRTYYNIIGAKNMRVDKGATINEILNDIADSIGVTIPGDKDNPTNAFVNLVNYLKDGKPNKQNLVSDYLNSFNAEDIIKGIITGEPAIEELGVVFEKTEKKVENATKKMITSKKELIQSFSKLSSFNDLQGIFDIIDRIDDRSLLNATSNLLSNFGSFSDEQWEQIINRMNNRRNTLPEIDGNQSNDKAVRRTLHLKKGINRTLIDDAEVEQFVEEVVEQYVEDFTESANKYFREAMLRGTGFENGKKRVFDFFTQEGFKLSSKNTINFLKKEFGEGGFSGKLSEGYGLLSMYSSASGIDFSWIDKSGTVHNEKKKWNEAAKVISELINEQIYYIEETSNEAEKVQVETEKKKKQLHRNKGSNGTFGEPKVNEEAKPNNNPLLSLAESFLQECEKLAEQGESVSLKFTGAMKKIITLVENGVDNLPEKELVNLANILFRITTGLQKTPVPDSLLDTHQKITDEINGILNKNNIEIKDPTGSLFDIGSAVITVNNEGSTNANGKFFDENVYGIKETIKPQVLLKGAVIQPSQVILDDFDKITDNVVWQERTKALREEVYNKTLLAMQEKNNQEKAQNSFGQNDAKVPDTTHTQWKQDNEDIKEENKLIDTLNRKLSERNRKLVEGTKLIEEETDRVKVLFYYSKSSPGDTVTGGLSGRAFSTVPLTLPEDEVMTQWYANLGKIYEYGTKFTAEEAQIIVTQYLTGLSQGIQNELSRLLTSGNQKDMDKFFKETGLSPNSFYIGGLQTLGYEAFQRENLLQIFDLSKVFKATDLEVVVTSQMDKIFSQFYKITSPESDYRYVEDENGNKIFSEKYQNIGSELAKVGETFTEVVEKGVYKLYDDFEEYERLFGKMRILRSERTDDGTYKDTYEIMPNYQRTYYNKWEKGEDGPELVDYVKDVQTYQQLEEQAITITKELIKATADLNIEQSKGASADQNKIKSLTSLIGYYKKTRNELDLIATLMSQQTGSDFTIEQYTEAIKKGTEKQLLSSQGKVSIQTERFKKEIQTVYDSYLTKLEQFKSSNKDIERFLAEPIQNMESALYGLLYGKISIVEVKKAFTDLSSTGFDINQNFPAQLSKSASAYKSMIGGSSNILKLRREFEDLGEVALDTEEKLQNLETTLVDLKRAYRSNDGLKYTSLSRKYKDDLEQLKNEYKIQKQARKDFNVLDSQITSKIDSTKDLGSVKIDEELNKAKDSLDNLLNDFLLGNITIDEYIQKLKEFKTVLSNTFSSIEPIENLYISIKSTREEIANLSTQINELHAKIANAERLGKDTSVLNYQLEQLNNKLKESKDNLINMKSEVQSMAMGSVFSINERQYLDRSIDEAYNTEGSTESKLKREAAETELNEKKKKDAIAETTKAYKLYLEQLQKVFDLEYSNTEFIDTAKLDSEKEKLKELFDQFETLKGKLSSFNGQDLSKSFVEKNVANLKDQLHSFLNQQLKAFTNPQQYGEMALKLYAALQPTFDMVSNLETEFAKTGDFEAFVSGLNKAKEAVNGITTGVSKNDWNSFSQLNSILKNMEKFQFQANKINAFKQEVSELRQEFNNLFSNWTGTEEQQKQLDALIEKVTKLRTNANLYKTENSKGKLIQNDSFGNIKDLEDLKIATEEYLKNNLGYSNIKIVDDPKNIKGVIATYKDLNGEIKQVRASYDECTHSMRIQSTALNDQTSLLKNYIKGLAGLGKSYISHYLSGYMLVMRMISAFKQGVNYLKEYDKALTTISYTMDISGSELKDLGENARKLAEDLSISLSNAMEIYQIYANMKTTASEIEKVAKPTAILSNLAGIDASTAADEIQGVINQFQMTSDEAMHIADVYDYISSQIAVDYSSGIKDIAEAVGNVGNVAYGAGLSFEQLSAIIATTAEQTRQEGSQIGNALKTIMVRLSKASSMSDEVDTSTLSNASKALHSIGIEVYTASGEFREFDVIMSELSAKWDTLSDAQQQNVSYQIAATRQTATLKAILDNWTTSTKLATEATKANGNALKNQEKYEESYAGKLQSIKNQTEEYWLNFLNSDTFYNLLDLVDSLLEKLNKIPPILTAIGVIALAPLLSRNKEGKLLFTQLASGVSSYVKEVYKSSAATALSNTVTKEEVALKLQAALANGTLTQSEYDEALAKTVEGTSTLKYNNILSLSIAKVWADTKAHLKNIAVKAMAHPVITALTVAVIAMTAAFASNKLAAKKEAERIESITTAANEAKEKISELQQEYDNNKEKVADLAEEYAELSKEVGNLGKSNQNKGFLSNNEYERFLEISNELAEAFPTLISGFDEEGNKLLKLNGNAQTITSTLESLLKVQNELANRQILELMPDLFKGYSLDLSSFISDGKKLNNLLSGTEETISIFNEEYEKFGNTDSFKRIEISGKAHGAIYQALKELGYNNDKEQFLTANAEGYFINPYKWTVEEYEKVKEKMFEIYEETNTQINSLNNQKNALNKSMGQYIHTWLNTDNNWAISSLTEETKNNLQSFLLNTDWIEKAVESGLDISNWEKVKDYIQDNIITAFSTVNEDNEIQESLEKALEGTLSETNLENLLRQLQIKGLTEDNPIMIYLDTEIQDNTSKIQKIIDGIYSNSDSQFGSFDTSKMDFNFSKLLKSLKPETLDLLYNNIDILNKNLTDKYLHGSTSAYTVIRETIAQILEEQTELEEISSKKLSKWLNETSDLVSSDSDAKSRTYYSWSEAVAEYKSVIQELYDIVNDPEKNNSDLIDKVADSNFLGNFELNFEEYLSKAGDNGKEAVKAYVKDLQEAFITSMGDTGLIENIDYIFDSIDSATKKNTWGFVFNIKGSSLENVQKLSDGFDQLDKIYADVYNQNDFDWSSILNNDSFTESFEGLGEAYDNFVTTVANSPNNLSACQEAFNKLSTEYLRQSHALDNVTEETKNATIALLKQKGVSNAQAIVEEILTYKQEELALQQKYLSENSKEVTESTYEEISSFLEEENASIMASQAIFELALQKSVLENDKLDLSSDIKQIMNLATAAKVSAEYLKALNTLDYFKNKYGSDAEVNSWREALKSGWSQNDFDEYSRAKALLNNNYDWTDVDFQIDFDSMVKYVGGETSKSEKQSHDYVDFIEIAISRIEREITNLGKIVSATYDTWENRNNALLSEMQKVTEQIELQQSAYDAYMKMANSVGLSEYYKNLIQNGGLVISDIQDETLKTHINDYQTWYEKALSASDAIKDLQGNLAELAQTKFDNISKEYDQKLDAINHYVNMINGQMDIIETRNQIVGKSFYESLIGQENDRIAQLEAKYSSLSNAMADAINSGSIEYGSEQWASMVSEIESVEEEIQSSEKQIIEYGNSIKNVIKEVFDYLEGKYTSLIGLIENRNKITEALISLLETSGHIASSSYYEAESEVLQKMIEAKELELKNLQVTLEGGLNDGSIEKYDDNWIEMTGTIEDALLNLVELNQQLTEMNNNMRQMTWDLFDRGADEVNRLVDEMKFLSDIMNYDKLFDDYGNLNDRGLAIQGLYVTSYATYLAQAEKYAEEIMKINEELANDPNNTTLIDRRNELIDAQQTAISNAKSEKEAIKDLAEQGYSALTEKINDLISKYEKVLDTQKDLYDYEKIISEQNTNINNLQKQLMAYAGDDSEETRATLQKLATDLKDAQEDLAESEYNQWLTDQKALLTNMTDDLEEWVNARLDNIEGLLNNAIITTNQNGSRINDTLISEANYVGYTITSNLSTLWSRISSSNSSTSSTISGSVNNAASSINSVIRNEANDIWSMTKNVRNSVDDIYDAIYKLPTDISNNYSSLERTLQSYFNTNGGMASYFGSNTIQSIIDAINNLKAQVIESGNAIVKSREAAATSTSVSQNSNSSNNSSSSSSGSSTQTTTKPTDTTTTTTPSYDTSGQSKTVSYTVSTQSEIDRYKAELEKAGHIIIKTNVSTDSTGHIKGVTFTYKYAKGTDNAKAGLNLVGEAGREIYIDNDGNVSLVDEPSLIAMEGGERVIKNSDTEKILNSKYSTITLPTNMQAFANNFKPNGLINNSINASLIKGNVPKNGTTVSTTTVGDINITLPNVTNKEQFVTWLKNDGQIEKIIQTMTIGQAMGSNKYSHRI